MAYAAAMRNQVDIVIASEPNKKLVSGSRWLTDHSSDVAILLLNRGLGVNAVIKRRGILAIQKRYGL